MKNFLFALVAGCVAGIQGVNAQGTTNSNIQGFQKNVIERISSPLMDQVMDRDVISLKVRKDFARTYKNVTGASWIKNENGFNVKFTSEGIRNVVFYNNYGNWIGSLKSYTEEKLAYPVKNVVKREFYRYTITFVEEMETDESGGVPTYLVHIEDKRNIKLVRVHDGQLEVWKEYVKNQWEKQ